MSPVIAASPRPRRPTTDGGGGNPGTPSPGNREPGNVVARKSGTRERRSFAYGISVTSNHTTTRLRCYVVPDEIGVITARNHDRGRF